MKPLILRVAALLLGAALCRQPVVASPAPDEARPLEAFSAQYTADWKSINVGLSDLDLRHDVLPGHYLYVWTVRARGVFRLAYQNDVVQRSWLEQIGDHVRPLRYQAEDGASKADVQFDWGEHRVRGTNDERRVDLPLGEGVQDIMSIQVEVMVRLAAGTLPKTYDIVDKDEIKEFNYSVGGTARVRTPLGELDTVMVSSRRTGADRTLTMWFAPSLGFAPVQAERRRAGKLEFAMRLRSLTRTPPVTP